VPLLPIGPDASGNSAPSPAGAATRSGAQAALRVSPAAARECLASGQQSLGGRRRSFAGVEIEERRPVEILGNCVDQGVGELSRGFEETMVLGDNPRALIEFLFESQRLKCASVTMSEEQKEIRS
jgi:hypothetical protein